MNAYAPDIRQGMAAPKPAAAIDPVALLVVEDEPFLGGALSATLETEDGLTVRCAGSVAEARREVAAQHTDLIQDIRRFSASQRCDDDVCVIGMEFARMGERAVA